METNSKSKIKLNITGLLLCAGMSGRMGTLKALMVYNGLPFASSIINKLLSVCNEVIVVVGHKSDKVISSIMHSLKESENRRIHFVFNDNYKTGMFSSLQCGLRSITNNDWILYHFVDQPTIPISFYTEFVNQVSKQVNWIQPINSNKLGHPILFNRTVSSAILKLNAKSSLRDLKLNIKIKRQLWDCNYPEILIDVDTPEQYNSLTIGQIGKEK